MLPHGAVFGSDDKRALTQPTRLATKVLQIGREGKREREWSRMGALTLTEEGRQERQKESENDRFRATLADDTPP